MKEFYHQHGVKALAAPRQRTFNGGMGTPTGRGSELHHVDHNASLLRGAVFVSDSRPELIFHITVHAWVNVFEIKASKISKEQVCTDYLLALRLLLSIRKSFFFLV